MDTLENKYLKHVQDLDDVKRLETKKYYDWTKPRRSNRLSLKKSLDYKVFGTTGEKTYREYVPQNYHDVKIEQLKTTVDTLNKRVDELEDNNRSLWNRCILYENLYLDEVDKNSYNMIGNIKDIFIILLICLTVYTQHGQFFDTVVSQGYTLFQDSVYPIFFNWYMLFQLFVSQVVEQVYVQGF